MTAPILDAERMVWGATVASLDADVQRLKAFVASSPTHAEILAERHAREEAELAAEVLLADQAEAVETAIRSGQEIQRLLVESDLKDAEIARLRGELAAARYGVTA